MGEALTRGQLATLLKHRQLGVRGFANALLQRPKIPDQCQHVATVGLKRLGAGIYLGLEDRQASTSSCRGTVQCRLPRSVQDQSQADRQARPSFNTDRKSTRLKS